MAADKSNSSPKCTELDRYSAHKEKQSDIIS